MQEGDIIDGRYRVDKTLGQGGMGQVFRGHDMVLDKTVAIKVLFPNTSDLVIKRFHAEAVALGQLKHPNILSVQHFGQAEDGVLYLVMDFIEGESLDAMIESRGVQTFFDVLPIFEKICRGLRYAHSNNVLHRDIKPSNVMMEMDRSRDDSIKLVDFGLAKQADKEFDLTKAGSAMGTPGYMSPEVIHGKESDVRSDIYGLGCTFFEMMTGRLPFVEENALKSMMAHVKNTPPTLSEVTGKTYDPEVEEFIQRCLKKDPEDRFQNMDQLVAELNGVKEKLLARKDLSKAVPSSMYASGLLLADKIRRADRSLKIFLAVFLLIGALVTAGGIYMWNRPVETENQDESALNALTAETNKLQKQDEQQSVIVEGLQTGVSYDPGPENQNWCRVYGKLTDEQLQEKLKPYKNVPNYSFENLVISSTACDAILLDSPIEKLRLYNCKVTEDLIKRIVKMNRLSYLSVDRCGELPKNFFVELQKSKLTALNVEVDKNHPHPGAALASIKLLQKITLVHAQLNRSDLRSIVQTLDLRSMILNSCAFSPDAFADLNLAKNCVAFTVTESKLTAKQFEDISKVPSLQYVNLSMTNLDDKSLRSFTSCKNLQKVILIGTSVTPTGAAVLQASLPQVQVTLRAPTYDPY